MKDTLAVQTWLKCRCSLADVEAAEAVGFMGNIRFTPQAVRLYRLLWLWTGVRMGPEHDRAWNRLGPTLYASRLKRGMYWAAKLSK